MLTLYYGPGALGFHAGPVIMDEAEWNKLKSGVQKLLIVRRWPRAADILVRYPFRICLGENDFGDSFSIVYAKVTLPIYVELEEIHRAPGGREIFATIAKTITELGHYIRFVAVDLALSDAPDPVANPSPVFTTAVVERALVDAEQLLSNSGPISAVDRVHTALHGYLQEIVFASKGARSPYQLWILLGFSGSCGRLEYSGNQLTANMPKRRRKVWRPLLTPLIHFETEEAWRIPTQSYSQKLKQCSRSMPPEPFFTTLMR